MPKSKWTKEEMDRRWSEMLGDEADTSPGARKRRRILRAAHELFLVQGYRKTSIDDVARKAEVAKGTVYLYFENKGQLLIHAVVLEKASLRTRVAPLFDGSIPKKDRLRLYLMIALTSARDLPLSARLLTGDTELFAALEDAGAGELATRKAEGTEFAMELIEDAVPGRLTDEEKRARAEVILGLGFASGMFLDERIRGRASLDEYAATLADLVIHGLGGPRKDR
jgi:AcrR family transcriptional regulator